MSVLQQFLICVVRTKGEPAEAFHKRVPPGYSQSLRLKSLGARADHSLMVFTVLFM